MVGTKTIERSRDLETEADAYAFLERVRWGDDGPTQCPHCGSDKGAWFLKPKNPAGRKSKGGSASRSHRRVWKCRENTCRRQFSVLTNTVMHATKMPVRAWVGTIVDLCADPTGVSAREIAVRWAVTEKSAWAMLSRINHALAQPEAAGARLASNAPLWLELSATETMAADDRRGQQEELAARQEQHEREAKKRAAQRIERDVQRTLTVDTQTADTAETHTAKTAETRTADTETVVSEPTPARITPAADAAASSVTSGAERMVAAKHLNQGDSQVRSDVERVLAEVFGEGIPLVKAGGDTSQEAQSPQGARPSAKSVPGATPKRPRAKQERTDKTSKQRQTTGASGSPSVASSKRTGGDKSSARAKARRARVKQERASKSGQDASAMALGVGWLDDAETATASTHTVSANQGQLRGVDPAETAALGPEWSSPSPDLAASEQQGESSVAGQMPLFDDDGSAKQ